MSTDTEALSVSLTITPVANTFRKAADGSTALTHPKGVDGNQFAPSLNNRVFLSAQRFVTAGTANRVDNFDTDKWCAWMLDQSTQEDVTAMAEIPGWWKRFKIDALVANPNATGGVVAIQVQRAYHWNLESLSGATNRSNSITEKPTLTGASQNQLQVIAMEDQLTSDLVGTETTASIAVPTSDPSQPLVDPIWRFRFTRVAADAGDTLAGDLAFMGLMLTRLG